MKRALVLWLVCVGAIAHANVWQHAIEKGSPDPAQDVYDSEMADGDNFAAEATAKGASPKTVRQLVERATSSYRNAAAAKPKEGEPYFRIGRLLYSLYFEYQDTVNIANLSPLCFGSIVQVFDRKHAQEVIDAWDAFEARAPLDPRLSVNARGENEILFRRAILHTKLTSKEHLEAAARDYEKILAREDSADDHSEDPVRSNLAETYMMLGRVEDAIDMYREALRRGASTSTEYGYAVALDRDERSGEALDVMRSVGRDELDKFHRSVMQGETFFVPRGEEYYYYALAHEAFDETDEAIEYWQQYIKSGAHPEFQPRAKAHLAALATKHHGGIPKAPWQELLP